jgi:hypothetical protein
MVQSKGPAMDPVVFREHCRPTVVCFRLINPSKQIMVQPLLLFGDWFSGFSFGLVTLLSKKHAI